MRRIIFLSLAFAVALVAANAPCLTLDDVVTLKELGIDESTIIQKVKDSGTSFVLGDADLARLKKAGASDELVAAMRATKTTAKPVQNVVFILDCSGSMQEPTTDGETKISVARRAFADLVNKISPDLEVGVVAFGHGGAGADRHGIEVLRRVGAFDKANLVLAIAKLAPKGRTPIASSLGVAAGELMAKGGDGSIVLISDGKESEGGDPVGVAETLRRKHGIQFGIHVVGFGVSDAERGQLEKIAEAGGGQYFHAKNAKDLGESFTQVAATIAAPAAPPRKLEKKEAKPENLLAQGSGGQLVLGSDPGWKNVNDGSTRSYVGLEPRKSLGVFAFRDGKVATIESVGVHVPNTHHENVKELEVLVSTTSPSEGFTSLGVMKPVNAMMMADNGFQKFAFDPVKARYVKFVPLAAHGGGSTLYLYQLQVWGVIDEEQPAGQAPQGPTGRELLEQAGGGALVMGSAPTWKNVHDGSTRSYVGLAPKTSYGVFTFRDERPATINAVGVYVPKTDHENVKELEVLVSTTGPAEGFSSAGVMKPANAFTGKNGFQVFTFDPVEAKYVKFVPLSAQGGGSTLYLYQLQVWGELDKEQPAAPAPKGPAGRELLEQASGGTLVMGSAPAWKNVHDGSRRSYVGLAPKTSHGVFAFRSGQVATINAVGVYIPKTDHENVKELEVLVSTTSPAEGYSSIGVMKPTNAFAGKNGFQVFTFEPVKAKYVKFVPLSAQGGGGTLYLYQLQVWGELAP